MKFTGNKGPFFTEPSGQVTVDTPDGVTKTMPDGCAPNSLTNSNYACGGPFGGGYGAFTQHSKDGTNSSFVMFMGDHDRSNAGITDTKGDSKSRPRFRID